MNEDWLKQIRPEIGHYLAGFVDGEGSFSISMRKRDDHKLGWQIILVFNVSQRDKTLLALLKHWLGCGTLWQRRDGVWYYTVLNPTSIKDKVIPFFERFGFLSAYKKRNFSIFRQVVKMMSNNEHLTPGGMEKIIKLRELINIGRGRKRKYNYHDYSKSLLENPQRLYVRVQPRTKRPELDKR